MACGQRLLAGEGLSVFQSNLAKGFYRGLTPQQLVKNLNQFSSGFISQFFQRNNIDDGDFFRVRIVD
jgi:hypothetical protein